MKKQDLKTGMRCECNDGIYIVILGDFDFEYTHINNGMLASNNKFISLNKYNENLKLKRNRHNNNYDIFKIYDNPIDISNLLDANYKGKLLWERNTLVFKDFIIENGIDWNEFMLNCKIENQRWECVYYYNKDEIDYYKSTEVKYWLSGAFNWTHSLCQTLDKLIVLGGKWKTLIDSYEGEIVFE